MTDKRDEDSEGAAAPESDVEVKALEEAWDALEEEPSEAPGSRARQRASWLRRCSILVGSLR